MATGRLRQVEFWKEASHSPQFAPSVNWIFGNRMSDSLLQSEESSPLLGTNASIEDDRSARKQNSDRERKMALAQIKPFLRIAIPFFRENRAASCCLFGLVCLTLVNSAMTILFSYVKRDLYDALSEKDEETFYKCMLYFLAVLVVAVPIAVFYSYLRARLALSWREALTARVLEVSDNHI